MTEWKALANAVVHDGYDPNIKCITLRCDQCGCPVFYIPFEKKMTVHDGETLNIYMMQCPECGAKELNCCGTYLLPDYLPTTVLTFIGSFIAFMSFLHLKMNDVAITNKIKQYVGMNLAKDENYLCGIDYAKDIGYAQYQDFKS